MRVAITGASGRLGGAVVAAALAEGMDVTCLDRVPLGRPGVRSLIVELADQGQVYHGVAIQPPIFPAIASSIVIFPPYPGGGGLAGGNR